MKGFLGRYDAVGTAEVFGAPQTRELDCALVCLGTRVGEESLPDPVRAMGEHVRDALGKFATMLDVEVVAHVQELVRLLGDGLGDARVAVPDAHDADAREEVEILVSLVVDEPLPGSRHELDRLARKGVHDVGVIELPCPIELLAHFPTRSFLWSGSTGRACSRSCSPVPRRSPDPSNRFDGA